MAQTTHSSSHNSDFCYAVHPTDCEKYHLSDKLSNFAKRHFGPSSAVLTPDWHGYSIYIWVLMLLVTLLNIVLLCLLVSGCWKRRLCRGRRACRAQLDSESVPFLIWSQPTQARDEEAGCELDEKHDDGNGGVWRYKS